MKILIIMFLLILSGCGVTVAECVRKNMSEYKHPNLYTPGMTYEQALKVCEAK